LNSPLKTHAVHRLFEARLAQSTKPFNARGGSVVRCQFCRIDKEFCTCALKPEVSSNAGFLLLYYDDEVLKPSNTGKLIADLLSDTFAYIWKRTEVDKNLTTLLSDASWYPILVFPEAYVEQKERLVEALPELPPGKRPLFVLLDGSWREAKKMFRKSPYLDELPVWSVDAERASEYLVRKAAREHQLATAEVASFILEGIGEVHNAEVLRTWFDLFSYRYQQGVKRTNQGDSTAESRLKRLQSR
jgi:DTW domain-containing protein YfiP